MSDVYSCSWVLPNEESEVDEPVWLLAEYLNLRLPALDLSVVPIFRLTRKQSNRSALIAINQRALIGLLHYAAKLSMDVHRDLLVVYVLSGCLLGLSLEDVEQLKHFKRNMFSSNMRDCLCHLCEVVCIDPDTHLAVRKAYQVFNLLLPSKPFIPYPPSGGGGYNWDSTRPRVPQQQQQQQLQQQQQQKQLEQTQELLQQVLQLQIRQLSDDRKNE